MHVLIIKWSGNLWTVNRCQLENLVKIQDCDVLFAKACYHCAAGETETAIKILAVAQELYPQEQVIEENLKNLCGIEKRS